MDIGGVSSNSVSSQVPNKLKKRGGIKVFCWGHFQILLIPCVNIDNFRIRNRHEITSARNL